MERIDEAQELASEHASDPNVDLNTNDLHSGKDQVCPVCGRAIGEGQAVRKRIDGTYQHDAC